MARMSEVLPAPLAPTMADDGALLDGERDAVERLGVAVEDVEVFDGEHHPAGSSSSASA